MVLNVKGKCGLVDAMTKPERPRGACWYRWCWWSCSKILPVLLVFYKIIGLATFTYRRIPVNSKERSKGVVLFVDSKLGILYNLLLICGVVTWCCMIIPVEHSFIYPNKSNLTTIIETVQDIFGSLVMIAIFLKHCFGQKRLIVTANRIVDVNKILDNYSSIARKDRLRDVLRSITLPFFVVFSIYCCLMVTEILNYSAIPIFFRFTDTIPTQFFGLCLFQYYVVITFLENAFLNVNQTLSHLTMTYSSMPTIFSCELLQSQRVFVSTSTIERLCHLREIHARLCRVTNDVAEFYSFPILGCIGILFVSLIYNSYYFVLPFVMHDDFQDLMTLINTMLWMISVLSAIGLLTFRVTSIVNELQLFSLQLLHQHNRFTACGLFVLDNTLLQSVISATTTYLVILIQFYMGSTNFTNNKKAFREGDEN